MVIVMQMLILPMLAHAFQNGQTWEVIDATTIKTIVDKLLDPPEEVHMVCIFDWLSFMGFSRLNLFIYLFWWGGGWCKLLDLLFCVVVVEFWNFMKFQTGI